MGSALGVSRGKDGSKKVVGNEEKKKQAGRALRRTSWGILRRQILAIGRSRKKGGGKKKKSGYNAKQGLADTG